MNVGCGRIRSFWCVVLPVGLAAACGAPQPSSTPSPVPTPAVVLPTVHELGHACAGVNLDAALAGDPTDPRVAWLKPDGAPNRIEIVFPPGFSARFSPHLEILDAVGVVVAREGDHIDGGCVISPSEADPLLVLWDGSP